MHLQVKMPQNRYKWDIWRQRSSKKVVTIVFKARNAETKTQSTSLEVVNQEARCDWFI